MLNKEVFVFLLIAISLFLFPTCGESKKVGGLKSVESPVVKIDNQKSGTPSAVVSGHEYAYEYVAMLTPAIFGSRGNYLGDFPTHSLGYKYGNLIFTASLNTDVEMAIMLAADSNIARAISKGDATAQIIEIKSFLPNLEFEILEKVALEFPEDFPSSLKKRIAVFRVTSGDAAQTNYIFDDSEEEEIEIGAAFVVGQVRSESDSVFRLIEKPIVITAVSRDKNFFTIQGATFLHDMGGVVFRASKSGGKVPIGIIIDVIPGFETQALAVSLGALIDFFGDAAGQPLNTPDIKKATGENFFLDQLTRNDIMSVLGPEGILEVFKNNDYDYDYAKYGLSLMKYNDKRKCIAAHSVPIKSQIDGTHGFSESFDGLGVVIGNYVFVPVEFAPNIEKMEKELSEQIAAQAQFPLDLLMPGMPPPPPEFIEENKSTEREKVELRFIIVLSVGESIEILTEVARDESSGVVLFERPGHSKQYSVPKDCPIELADTSLLEVELGKSYDVGIAGYHPDFRGKNEIMAVEYGYLIDINQATHEFLLDQVSVLPQEIGGAVYFGMDGEPRLAAMIVRNRALLAGYETIAVAIDINHLIKIFKEKGFDLLP